MERERDTEDPTSYKRSRPQSITRYCSSDNFSLTRRETS